MLILVSETMLKKKWNYFGVQENEIHLDKCEHHSCCRCDGHKDIMAMGIYFNFEVLGKFQSRVNHATNSES